MNQKKVSKYLKTLINITQDMGAWHQDSLGNFILNYPEVKDASFKLEPYDLNNKDWLATLVIYGNKIHAVFYCSPNEEYILMGYILNKRYLDVVNNADSLKQFDKAIHQIMVSLYKDE